VGRTRNESEAFHWKRADGIDRPIAFQLPQPMGLVPDALIAAGLVLDIDDFSKSGIKIPISLAGRVRAYHGGRATDSCRV
jgi:hypothetical protein